MKHYTHSCLILRSTKILNARHWPLPSGPPFTNFSLAEPAGNLGQGPVKFVTFESARPAMQGSSSLVVKSMGSACILAPSRDDLASETFKATLRSTLQSHFSTVESAAVGVMAYQVQHRSCVMLWNTQECLVLRFSSCRQVLSSIQQGRSSSSLKASSSKFDDHWTRNLGCTWSLLVLELTTLLDATTVNLENWHQDILQTPEQRVHHPDKTQW